MYDPGLDTRPTSRLVWSRSGETSMSDCPASASIMANTHYYMIYNDFMTNTSNWLIKVLFRFSSETFRKQECIPDKDPQTDNPQTETPWTETPLDRDPLDRK